MDDPRIRKLAALAVDYCLDVEPGNTVGIQGESIAEPMALSLFAEVLRKGAHPHVMMSMKGQEEVFYSLATEEHLSTVSPFRKFEVENLDRMITIMSSSNLKALTNVDPEKQAKHNAAYGELFRTYMERFASQNGRLVILPFPTAAMAQEAQMGTQEYEDFVYSACHVDQPDPMAAWRAISAEQQRLVDVLDHVDKLRIVGEGTDLEMSLKGRTWMNCDGHINMPDGEVCTSPVEDSVKGSIRFTYPGIFQGKEIEDVQLVFDGGEVAEYSARKGEELLEAILSVDGGSKRTGEVAIGTNENIKTFTKNILFDEKLGHTIHLAVGAGLPMCGGKNQSAIHWDLLKDMRDGGRILADGKEICRDGEILI